MTEAAGFGNEVFHRLECLTISYTEGPVLQIEVSERRKLWDGGIGLRLYMECLKEAIEENESTAINDFNDDGDYILLSYNINLPGPCMIHVDECQDSFAGGVENAMKEMDAQTKKVVEEIEGRAMQLAKTKIAA